jgi:glucokinase
MTYTIGIDVGGSKIAGVLLTPGNGRPKASLRAPTPKSKNQFERAIRDMVRKLSEKRRVRGVGLGLPGVLDYKRGILIRAGNLPRIRNWNARRNLLEFRVPVMIDNDSRCFVRAEAQYGAGRRHKNVVGIAIGTGIGGGIVVNGTLVYGAHGRAGEVGHMVIGGKKTFQDLGAKRAFLRSGDVSKIIGVGAANLIHVLDPHIVIIGGGGGLSREVNLAVVRRAANQLLQPEVRGKTPIVRGALGEFASAIGAAMLFISPRPHKFS